MKQTKTANEIPHTNGSRNFAIYRRNKIALPVSYSSVIVFDLFSYSLCRHRFHEFRRFRRRTRYSRRAVCGGNLIRTVVRGGLYKQTENGCYCLQAGWEGWTVWPERPGQLWMCVYAPCPWLQRPYFWSKKRDPRFPRAPEEEQPPCLVSEREFLNPDCAMQLLLGLATVETTSWYNDSFQRTDSRRFSKEEA